MTADPIARPIAVPPAIPAAPPASAETDPVASLDPAALAVLAAVADHLIPAGHGMPSAATVVGDTRLRFVLAARPDLLQPLLAALRPGLGDGSPGGRLAALEAEGDHLAALQQVVVFAYYTDRDVRERLGYPGQMAKTLYSWKVPDFIEEGLIDQVLARGAVWRDPATGRRADVPASAYEAHDAGPAADRRGEPS